MPGGRGRRVQSRLCECTCRVSGGGGCGGDCVHSRATWAWEVGAAVTVCPSIGEEGFGECGAAGLPESMRAGIASVLFRLPIVRQVYYWMGCFPAGTPCAPLSATHCALICLQTAFFFPRQHLVLFGSTICSLLPAHSILLGHHSLFSPATRIHSGLPILSLVVSFYVLVLFLMYWYPILVFD